MYGATLRATMSQPLLDVSAAHLRVALRAYFTACLALLALVGNRCCSLRVKLRLFKYRSFAITHMTGWLTGTDAALTMFRLRTSPAGWLGVVMILASLAWIASDFAVSGLVVSVDVVSRCSFDTTGLFYVTQTSPFNYAYVGPAWAGRLYNMIVRARDTSQLNGGLNGIYAKINSNPKFRAASEDLLGGWTCEDLGDDKAYPGDTSIESVRGDLQAQGLLYAASSDGCYQVYPDASTNHYVLWSASEPEHPSGPWEVLASVDITQGPYADKVMRTYHCQMNATSLNWLLAKTLPQFTLNYWCAELKGELYSDADSHATLATDPGAVIESVLNAVIMAGGGTGNLTDAPILDPTQGCLAPRTQVSWLVILLFVLVTAATVLMTLYWIVLSRNLHRARLLVPREHARAAADDAPNSLIGWMAQAARETGFGPESQSKDLKSWYFGLRPDGETLGLFRAARSEPAYTQGFEPRLGDFTMTRPQQWS